MIETEFVGIIQKLISEKGIDIFLESKKLKSLLLDYTKNEFKKETALLLSIIDADCAQIISRAENLAECRQFLVKRLEEDYSLSPLKSVEMLDLLFHVFRGVEPQVIVSEYKNIFIAASKGTIDDLKYFIEENGIDVNVKDEDGDTPLHRAASRHENNTEIIKFLITKKADIEAKDNFGRTPICLAAQRGNFEHFVALFSLGANINMQTNDGSSLLSIAKSGGNAAIVNFLTDGKRNLSDENLKNSWAVTKRGLEYMMKNDYNNAIKEYSEGIRLDRNNAEHYQNRGIAYIQIGQFELGINDFNEAISINPNEADAYRLRGMVFSQLGQHEQAIIDLTDAIKLKANDYIAHMSRGVSFRALQQKDKARQDFEKVISLNPDITTLGQAKSMLEEIDK
ncbi:MAG: ankyrin repeat domain-containing protein [Treponema sp.]|jgi:tetratricopeptide (TPR) repeat protein|nr:ankyrin repeat domain-containing protein [Treponema sp.]